MARITITDQIKLRVEPSTVFAALTEAERLALWWPVAAESDARLGGRLVLTWSRGSKTQTQFETFVEGQSVAFPFGSERVAFRITDVGGETELRVEHSEVDSQRLDSVIHIAQAWAFLLTNLKCQLEHGLDLRAARD